jgi:nanoRNase/pAp phosphatase (c-di-AMP/oligoRNAs hydrolase)
MQVKSENFTLLGSIISKAKKAAILLGKDPDMDTLLAGVFLKENLLVMGKKADLISIGKLPTDDEQLAKKISNKLPVKKLLISFNWKKNAIEKVSYNMEGDNFNFIVNPLNKKIDIDDIRFSYEGDDADLIVTLGEKATQIEGLEEDFFENRTIINISKTDNGQEIGSLNFINPNADCLSAMVVNIVEKAGIAIEKDAVEFAFEGIKTATNGFKDVKDPLTFEAAAFCTAVKEKNPSATAVSQDVDLSAEWLSPKIFKSKESPN